MLRRVIMTLALPGVLAACAAEAPAPAAPAMSVNVAFGQRNYCGMGVSPAISIVNPPPGTARYKVRMVNTEVLFPSAFEATVESAGATIGEGALANYPGPCPGEYQRPRYRFTVSALDGGGRTLASAENTQLVVPLQLLVQRNREGVQQPAVNPVAAIGQQRIGGPLPVIEIRPTDEVSTIAPTRLYRDPSDEAFGTTPIDSLEPERVRRANSVYSIY